MRLHLGTTVPAWALRVPAFALAAIAAVVVTSAPLTTAVLVLAAVPVLVAPGTALPVVTAGLIGWGLLAGDAHPVTATVVVLCVPSFLAVCRLVGGVGWAARVEVSAVSGAGRPLLGFVAIALAVMHLAMAAPAAGPGWLWAGIGALAALAVLTGLLTRRLRAMN